MTDEAINLSEAASMTGMFYLPQDACPFCRRDDCLYRDILGMWNCENCGWDETQWVTWTDPHDDPYPWVSPNGIRYAHPANDTYEYIPRVLLVTDVNEAADRGMKFHE